jgi:hypothetical protein
MIDTQSDAYTKTGAYNFLKDLLGVSKKIIINENFFNLFFIESGGFYLIKKPEDIISNIFAKNGIAELNKMYFQLKQENNSIEAEEIANQVMEIARASLGS